MINRIRAIRKQKGLTLTEVAERCSPPTTAQTIGRIETGLRQLSLKWMDRIAAALEVDPALLVKAEAAETPQVIARWSGDSAEALAEPHDALLPTALGDGSPLVVMTVDEGAGHYRTGDQVWLRQFGPEHYPRLLNRDVLVPRPGGRMAFGRMINRDERRVAILPPGPGSKQVVVENPAWIAVTEMLVRPL